MCENWLPRSHRNVLCIRSYPVENDSLLLINHLVFLAFDIRPFFQTPTQSNLLMHAKYFGVVIVVALLLVLVFFLKFVVVALCCC